MERKHGGFWIKVHGGAYQQSGLPDLIGCFDGYFIGMEVKVPERRNTVTKLQKQTLKEIRQAGGTAYVVTSVEEAEKVVQKVKDTISDEIG